MNPLLRSVIRRSKSAGSGVKPDVQGFEPRHDRASELDEWDCVDELVDEEDWGQVVVA